MPKAFVYPALRSTRDNFKCPSCDQALIMQDDPQPRTYRCNNQHSFDLAREGYLNLLLPQHKRSRNPGDSDEMIRSRQRFLNAGYYEPLSDAIVAAVAKAASGPEQTVLDLGCGEGYYMQQLRMASATASTKLKLLGMDISKFAVRLAAKRKMDARLAVDSVYNIPLFENRVDTAISVFSPISIEETARVLKPGGQLIMVGPGAEHLAGLTALIYEQSLPHGGNTAGLEKTSQFNLLEQIEIKQTIVVTGSDILDLLKMTPYYWHSRPEQQEMLAKLDKLETLIHFKINVYQNQSS
ncbi:methyltransferase domain-containing protein [SAR92 clade bacterium H455]|uniref:Methyltransferase domain-containing protein n=1 Tax=SAR92 clade bacterium H455 TaxID=2974818 RepID=A0ABY5TMJ2_9GAMM|nr:methyltransferase domain-containing protein [SAR92 clade bacterium H455]